MGTVTGPSGPQATNPDYPRINQSAAVAYQKQTGKPSAVAGNTTLPDLLSRCREILAALNDPYQPPAGTKDNEAIVLYLNEFATKLGKVHNHMHQGTPDQKVKDAMVNANHKSCIEYLDAILQGFYDIRHHPFDAASRPTYDPAKTESDYFVAYVDALGNVPLI